MIHTGRLSHPENSTDLSWKEMAKGQIEERISKLKQNFKQPCGKVLQNADVKACLSHLHSKYVFIPADKAPNNIIIICKKYYIDTLIKELGLDNCSHSNRKLNLHFMSNVF